MGNKGRVTPTRSYRYKDSVYGNLRKLTKTMHEGSATAAMRGHKIGWDYGGDEWYAIRDGRCIYCGLEITALAEPAPNQINLSGEALAKSCPGWRDRFPTKNDTKTTKS